MKKVYYFLFFIFVSCSNNITKQNMEDINKVNIGMHYKEAISIMRNDTISSMDNPSYREGVIIYLYENNSLGASDYFSITFSKKDSLVIEVGYGD